MSSMWFRSTAAREDSVGLRPGGFDRLERALEERARKDSLDGFAGRPIIDHLPKKVRADVFDRPVIDGITQVWRIDDVIVVSVRRHRRPVGATVFELAIATLAVANRLVGIGRLDRPIARNGTDGGAGTANQCQVRHVAPPSLRENPGQRLASGWIRIRVVILKLNHQSMSVPGPWRKSAGELAREFEPRPAVRTHVLFL